MGYRPWVELGHPRSAGLNDFKFHVVLVPETVSAANNVFGFEVDGLDIAQRNLFVAKRENAFQMLFNQFDKLEVRFQPAPLELIHPLPQETSGAGFGAVAPQMSKRFLEQMSFQQFGAGRQKIVQGIASFAPHSRFAREEDELLAG